MRVSESERERGRKRWRKRVIKTERKSERQGKTGLVLKGRVAPGELCGGGHGCPSHGLDLISEDVRTQPETPKTQALNPLA